MLTINDLFDNNYYLNINPDVAAAVARGEFGSSGLEHFMEYGRFERRNPSAMFDTNFYLALYPDVEAAVQDGSITASDHFLQYGQTTIEKRDPILEFNTEEYLNKYPDIKDAVNGDVLTGYEHFIKYGQYEYGKIGDSEFRRDPSFDFPTKTYLDANADVKEFLDKNPSLLFSPIQHYRQFGINEERLFSTRLNDDNLFLATNLGVLSATPIATNSVATTENVDIYSFNLPSSSIISLKRDTKNVLQLGRDINNDRVINQGNEILYTITPDRPEITTEVLPAGTYFAIAVRLDTPNYNLILSATPATPPALNGFDPNFGFGLVNAKTAIERTIGKSISAVPLLTKADGDNFEDLNLINVSAAWAAGYTGKGIRVAVIDNGVNSNHFDLRRNILTDIGRNEANDNNKFMPNNASTSGNDPTKFDPSQHGTHIAGTIAAARNGFGTTGVAYDAQIIPIKAQEDGKPGLDLSGQAVSKALTYAANNGAKVINLSLSYAPGTSENDENAITNAVNYAVSKGAVVIATSGNDSGENTNFPASLAATIPGVIAVGAVDDKMQQAKISNGSKLDDNLNGSLKFIVAPGVDVLSTTGNRQYQAATGTSQAAPHVAGVAALVWQAARDQNIDLKPQDVVDILTGTTTKSDLFPRSLIA